MESGHASMWTLTAIGLLCMAQIAVSQWVVTESEITLIAGKSGSLPCDVRRKSFAVYWKKGMNFSTAEYLVTLDLHYKPGEKVGKGYEEGKFDITPEYSLLIKNVSVQSSGRYFCEFSDFETGTVFRNHTNVLALTPPGLPLITSPDTTSQTDNYVLSWQHPSDNGGSNITNYLIHYYQSGNAGPISVEHTIKVDHTQRDFPITCLTGNTLYKIELRAANRAGEGRSAFIQVKTNGMNDVSDLFTVTPSEPIVISTAASSQLDIKTIYWIVISCLVVFLSIPVIVFCVYFIKVMKNRRHDYYRSVRY